MASTGGVEGAAGSCSASSRSTTPSGRSSPRASSEPASATASQRWRPSRMPANSATGRSSRASGPASPVGRRRCRPAFSPTLSRSPVGEARPGHRRAPPWSVYVPLAASGEDAGQVVADRLLELGVVARGRVAVVAPPLELGRVPEAPALHVVVAHLGHPLGAQRREGEVLALRPARLGAGHPARVGDQELAPRAPGVLLDVTDQRLQLGVQLGAALLGERGRDPDVLEGVAVVEPEQQRAEQRPVGRGGLVLAVARDDDVGRAGVLDLEHGAAVLGVRRPQRLRNQAVEPGALEGPEPLLGLGGVVGRRREVHPGRRLGRVGEAAEAGEGARQRGAPLGERPVDVRLVAEREQVEGDETRGGGLAQHRDAGLRRVDPFLQRLELQSRRHDVAAGAEQLAVDDAPLRQLLEHGGHDLGEVPGQRLGVPAGQLDLVAVAEDQAAEAVPLRLERQAGDVAHLVPGGVGEGGDRLREHRAHRRHHGQVHRAEGRPPGRRPGRHTSRWR